MTSQEHHLLCHENVILFPELFAVARIISSFVKTFLDAAKRVAVVARIPSEFGRLMVSLLRGFC